jgi:leader peptidase (prepilin peptidase)/N-methyltransferase
VTYVVGLLAVSSLLELIFWISKGRAIGYGDVRLMRASGLLLGWKLSILSLLLGCIIGSVIHLIRMKVSKEGHVLAMGPYLAAGIFLSVMWGEQFINWYISLLTVR